MQSLKEYGFYFKSVTLIIASVFFVLMVTGCGASSRGSGILKTMEYPGIGLTIKEVNDRYVWDTFIGKEGTFDSGEEMSASDIERIKGFYSEDVIYYRTGYACVVAHELCHWVGIDKKVCGEDFSFEDLCL
jgi:hypothetical protein